MKRISHYSIDVPGQLLKVSVYDMYVSSQYNVYINITDKQINEGCSIKFPSARTILAVCIKIFKYFKLSTSITLKYYVMQRISHYSIDAPGQLLKVSVAHWAPTVMLAPQKAKKKSSVRDSSNSTINITDKQINEGCSIKFPFARTVLAVCIKIFKYFNRKQFVLHCICFK
jgi:hypothetical protein